jgi:hypothetical protein
MLQNLNEEIRECLQRAEECRRRSEVEARSDAKADFLEMERRWLSLARSYEFSEQLARSAAPLSWRLRP